MVEAKGTKYDIAYLIRGEVKKHHEKLVKEVGLKFNETRIIPPKDFPHISIKSSFKTNKIEEVEKLIKAFVKTQKPSKITYGGYSHFRRFVAFSKVIFTKRGLKTQKDLIDELKKISWIPFKEKDFKWKPHATICFGFTKESFNNIWKYLQKTQIKTVELEFDNITIRKKPRKYWKIHKTFKIK